MHVTVQHHLCLACSLKYITFVCYLFTYSIMPHNVIPFFKNIFLIRGLKRIIVMNHIRDSIVISFV